MQLFDALGISWPIFIAQLVNFAILLFILYKIGYKHILNFAMDRKKRIAQGLEDAKNAEEAYKNARKQQTEVIIRARKEAQAILEESKKASEVQRKEAIAKTKVEIQKLADQSKASLLAERDKMMHELKEEVVELVIASTEQVLSGAIDEKLDKKWMKEQLSNLKT